MSSDSYSASGGWSGGSALQNTGQVLGNYLQKVKTYDPTSGSIVTASPSSTNTAAASSSLARAVNPAVSTPATSQATTAQPAVAATPVASYVAPASSTLAPAMGRAAMAVSSAGSLVNAPAAATGTYGQVGANGMGTMAGRSTVGSTAIAQPVDTVGGYISGNANNAAVYTYDPTTGKYIVKAHLYQPNFGNDVRSWVYTDAAGHTLTGIDAQKAWAALNTQSLKKTGYYEATDSAGALAKQNAEQASDLAAYQSQVAADTSAQSDLVAQGRAAADAARQKMAQDAADKAAAFTLAGQLQAPDTSKVDQSGYNDLARVASQYAGGGAGVDSGYLNYLGQQDLSTQASVNKVAHDTAYADAYNANYNTFVSALKAQQDASSTATAQRLTYDMQGVSDALDQLSQQQTQLSAGAQTKLGSTIVKVRGGLQDYQLAVKQYGADSAKAISAAQAVLSLASGFAAAGVKS